MLTFKLDSLTELNSTTIILIAVLVIWEMIWKALALWRAAQEKSKAWFVVLLLINSVGILPIIYLLATKKNAHASS